MNTLLIYTMVLRNIQAKLYPFSTGMLLTIVLLPLVGAQQLGFNKAPPNVLYVTRGETARLEWDYSPIADKDTKLGSYSPIWYYYQNSKRIQIAYEYKWSNPKWKFIIPSSCPDVLKGRLSKESTATLVISNVTTADSGMYECELVFLSPSKTFNTMARLIITDTKTRFTQFPPRVLYVSRGETARFVWNYHVDDKRQEFTSESPRWSFIDQNGSESIIGVDDKYTNNWDFVINRATCPPRLLNPDRVSRKLPATLVITNASTADNGIYKCSLMLKAGNPINHRVQLVVTVSPTFLSSHPKRSYQIIEGQDSKINCTAIGPPTPNITWVNIKDGSIKSQRSGNAVMSFNNIQRYHAGVYECQAKNNPSEGAKVIRTTLVIYYKPAIYKSNSPTYESSWNGRKLNFKCVTNGLPKPYITWYKPNGQQIRCGVKTLTNGSEVTVITTGDVSDYGLYKCQAENAAGKDQHFVSVIQLFPPGPPKIMILEDYDVQASSVTLRWTEPSYDGGSPVIDYKVQINTTKQPNEHNTSNTYTYLSRLTKNTRFTIKVFARNVVGYGKPSNVSITTNKQGKPTIPELIVMLLNNTESKLSVSLKWKKPDDNGGVITKYTIYMKEVKSKSEWEKIGDDVTNPNQLEFTITRNIVYGKTYMFIVTAWNKYGESIRDDSGAKTVNTTADAATYTIGKLRADENLKYSATTVGAITAILVLSLGLNVLLCLFLMKKRKQERREGTPNENRKQNKKNSKEETYDNDLALDDKVVATVTASFSQQPKQTGPEYEIIQQSRENTTPLHANRSSDPGQFVHEDQGPVYEPLRTRSAESIAMRNDNVQNPYEPLNITNQTADYQSLQTNNRESVI